MRHRDLGRGARMTVGIEGITLMELKRNAFGYLEVIPKPSKKELAAYYNAKYFNNDAADNPYSASYTEEEILHKQIDAAECEYFARADHKRLLDIGCGEGFFMSCFSKRGFSRPRARFHD